ncbi:hypothetical protein LMG26691_03714 [Achromobacter animicus]|nr:hypothetical protein LMG26691_03714 [Achromobacter animicus]
MAIDWIWSSKDSAGVLPAIGDQLVSMDRGVLRIRNPWIADSAMMGKLHASAVIGGGLAAACYFMAAALGYAWFSYGLLITVASVWVFMVLVLVMRVRMIKNLSDFVFDRSSGKVYYRQRGQVISGDWRSATAGHQSEVEFTGRAVVVVHSLIIRMQAETTSVGSAETKPVSLFVSIESNAPTEPFEIYVAQIWEFVRIFMDKGPDELPEPGESSWWNSPNVRICLTPAEALRHYLPWRTGEPNEMQGKSNWLLPLWFVFFPYNMFCALCWYSACQMLKVQGLPPPVPDGGRDEAMASRQR